MPSKTARCGHLRAARRPLIAFSAGAIAAGLTLAACGSSRPSSTHASAGKPSTRTTATASAPGIAAARAAIAPYVGHPSPFPALPPLKKLPPSGTTMAYIEAAIPQSVAIGKDLVDPTRELGVRLDVIPSQTSPPALQGAASTVLSQRPAALLLSAVAPQFFGDELHRLRPVMGDGRRRGTTDRPPADHPPGALRRTGRVHHQGDAHPLRPVRSMDGVSGRRETLCQDLGALSDGRKPPTRCRRRPRPGPNLRRSLADQQRRGAACEIPGPTPKDRLEHKRVAAAQAVSVIEVPQPLKAD
jgi:hypothetical protein